MLLSAAFFLALILFLFSGVMASGRGVVLSKQYLDNSSTYIPLAAFGFAQLRQGNLPLWNPHTFCGTPFFGNFTSAMLYPPNWLHLVLPLGTAINVRIIFHVLWAGLGVFFWCRRRGIGVWGARLAGALFTLSGSYFLRIYSGSLIDLSTMAWAPWLFLAIDGWLSDGNRAWCAAGMACVAMQVLAGHPQYAYYSALAAALYSSLVMCFANGPRRRVPGLLAIFAGGGMLAAVQILTGLQTAAESVRGGITAAYSGSFSLPPENFLTMLAPNLFGDLTHFPYFGRCYLWETCLFVSVTGLSLAISAAFSSDRTARVPALTALGLGLLSLGARVPFLYKVLYHALPGYARLRGTCKFGTLFCLFVCLLAGMGFDKLLTARWPKRWAWISGILGALVIAAALGLERGWARVLAGFSALGENYYIADLMKEPAFAAQSAQFAARQLIFCGTTLIALSALLFLTKRSKRFAYGVLVLALVESICFARNSLTTMPLEPDYPAAWSKILTQRAGDWRMLHIWTPYPDISLTLDAEDIWGYEQLISARYAQFMAFTQGHDPERASSYLSFDRIPPIYRLLRCRYVFLPNGKTIELPSPLGRLQLIRSYRVLSKRDDILGALISPRFDPGKTVILEKEPVPAPAGSDAAGTASVVASSTDWLEIEADLPAAAVLLVTDAYSAGWKARALPNSAQRDYEILPADYIMRAVPLSAGRHHFRLEYDPWGYRLGKWISLLSLAAFAWFWLTTAGVSATFQRLGARRAR